MKNPCQHGAKVYMESIPVKPYNNEQPYNNRPEDKALSTKYFIPDSDDLKLSLSIEAKSSTF